MPRNRFPIKHGMIRTPTYKSWQSMWTRCTNPKVASYADYGAKGVSVCERWRQFIGFFEDMGTRPAGTTLDRYPNPRGNYEIGNCRWATKIEQQSNTTTNQVIDHNGERLTQSEWARRLGIKQTTLSARIRAGWSAQEALTLTPRLGLKRSPLKHDSLGRFASKFGETVTT